MNLFTDLQKLIVDYKSGLWIAVAGDVANLIKDVLALMPTPAPTKATLAAPGKMLATAKSADDIVADMEAFVADNQSKPQGVIPWALLLPLLLQLAAKLFGV